MKKVLLIAPLSEEYSGVKNYGVPPIGVHRLSSFINSHGHYSIVYDCNIDGDIENYITREKWDIIGISILNNTLVLSLELLIQLKKRFPDSLLVCGNAESIVNYETIFENTDCDIVILGEGELPLLDLCNEKPLQEIKGIIFRKRGIEITDNLLWEYYKNIDFSKMGWEKYWDKNLIEQKGDKEHDKKVIRLVTSSHCNRGCSYCSLTGLHEFSCGRKVKPAMLNSSKIKILITRAMAQIKGGITHVYFVEDSILPTIKRLDDFCDALRAFPSLKYLVQTETDKVSREVIKKLAESNVIHITFGVENCSGRIRSFMGKRQNDEKIENIITWCNEFNIRCYYLIILFSPESVIDDLIINYETLNKWYSDKRLTISVEPYMMPYKQSRIYKSVYDFIYDIKILKNKKVVKYPTFIIPGDKKVREIFDEFMAGLQDFIISRVKEEGHLHQSKDHTGKYMIEYLGIKLKEKGYIK
jgi:anaerobic magnesium-protoporphyrin IX monomethyl ester cyclase